MKKRSSYLQPWSVVVLAGVTAALHIGKLPPAIPVLQQAMGATLVQAAFLLSMVQLAGMTLGLLVGLSADSLGLRRCMLTGLAILALASAVGGGTSSIDSMLICRALEGLGFLLVVMPAPALIRSCATSSTLNVRLSWWGTYMPLGSACALLLGPMVMVWAGWSVWWWLLAGVTLLAWLAVWWLVPAVSWVQPTRPDNRKAHQWPKRLRLTLTSPGPWLVSLSFAVYSSQWIAVIGFLPTMYAQAGLSFGLTGLLTAGVALANVVGNIMSGRLLQRGLPAQRVLQFGFFWMALGALGAFGQMQGAELNAELRFACVVLFSALGGLIPGTLFSMAVRLAPNEGTVSTTVGFMQQCSAAGQFAGPPLVAWVAAGVGAWHWTWVVTASLAGVGAILAHFIGQALQQMDAAHR